MAGRVEDRYVLGLPRRVVGWRGRPVRARRVDWRLRGAGNPAFVGVDAAAPLFFRIADALNLAKAGRSRAAADAAAGRQKVAVCADSGDLPNVHCPRHGRTWYIPGKSPIRVSQLHRAVAIDAVDRPPACPPYPAGTRFEVFEFWSSDMLKLFRQAGMPRRIAAAIAELRD